VAAIDVLIVTNDLGTSFDALAHQMIAHLGDGIQARTLPWRRCSNEQCDVAVVLWWRPLCKGLVDPPAIRARAVVGAVYDFHSWCHTPVLAADFPDALARMDLLAVANADLLVALQNYSLPPTFVCETGVDLETFRLRPPPARFSALWCGNSGAGENDLKGLGLVKAACAQIGAPLLIADSLGIEGPAIPYSQMPSWYEQGNVLVVGSSSEGTPRTALEAAASGRLVCGTRVGILPRLVQEGITGALASERTVASLADALACCRNAARGWSTTSRACRRNAGQWDVRFKMLSWRHAIMVAHEMHHRG